MPVHVEVQGRGTPDFAYQSVLTSDKQTGLEICGLEMTLRVPTDIDQALLEEEEVQELLSREGVSASDGFSNTRVIFSG
jgi:hypothetical protein